MSRPAASVIVPFAGSDAELDACLAVLGRLELRDGDEVLVADNRAAPAPGRRGVAQILDASGPASSYFARAVAAARARNPWLVFVDADCVPAADLLDGFLDPEPGARVGVLAGRVDDVIVRDTRVSRYVTRRRMLDQANTLDRADRREYAVTANAAVRREAFEAVGGWPDPVRSGGDADLCWRLAREGWQLERRPGARVEHRSRHTLRGLLAQVHRFGAGMQWLDARWPGAFPPPRPRELLGRTALLARGGDERLDFLCQWARDVGRLRANGDPAGVRR